MAAALTDHVWKLDELIALVDEAERAVPQKRGPVQEARYEVNRGGQFKLSHYPSLGSGSV